MLLRKLLAASAAFAIGSPAIAADTPTITAQRFGLRPSVLQMRLSPDGTHVAILATADEGRGMALLIGDLVNGGDPKSILRSPGDVYQLQQCNWVSDTRIVCDVRYVKQAGRDQVGASRIFSLNSDGSDMKMITEQRPGAAMRLRQFGGQVIDYGPDGATGSVLMMSSGTTYGGGLAVELVNATTLSRKLVEQPMETTAEYISDGHGNVRIRSLGTKIATGYDTTRYSFQYRKSGSRLWEALSDVHIDEAKVTGFLPQAVDPTANLAYGFDDAGGHIGLYSVALDGSLDRKLLVSAKDVDVTALIEIGRQHRVVGASWVTDRRTQQFFDPELQQLREALAKAIPGKLINFLDASADEKRVLLFASADNDPGTFYVFDKANRRLEEVAAVRPPLADIKLATMQAISYPAADGTSIPAYLTLPPDGATKNLPAIVMPHGGPGARDEWGFDWLAQFFAARGYAVIQPNFRGSTGYGDAWFQKNGFQSWKVAIGDVNDAGRWLTAQGIAAPGKLAIVGWSYGGYAALQTSVADPDLFKAIVAVAPVTDLSMLREERRNFTSFYDVDRFIGHGDHVRDGSPLKNAEKIKAPVLLFHGDIDANVGIAESRAMLGKLKDLGKPVELIEFKGLDHQLDDSDARATMLDKADRFLRAALGLPAGQ